MVKALALTPIPSTLATAHRLGGFAPSRSRLLDGLVTRGGQGRIEREGAALSLYVAGVRAVLQDTLGILQTSGVAKLQGGYALV
jgi:hypothetical protein